MQSHTGYTKTELLVVLASVVVLTVVMSVILSQRSQKSQRARDGEQLVEIHRAMVVLGQDNHQRYPVPGQFKTQPVDLDHPRFRIEPPDGRLPQPIPSSAAEDATQNTTAALYSLMIMFEYIPSGLPISPRERNPNVREIAQYDYAAYRPAEWTFWDESFKADLEVESHTSYAHLLLHGARMRMRWRHTNDSNTPILSNRGPRDGLPVGNSFTTRTDGSWAGFIVFGDNSVQWSQTMTPKNVLYEPFHHPRDPRVSPVPDNIFAAEFHDDWPGSPLGSNDAYLTFTLKMVPDGRFMMKPVIQHD